MVRVMGRFTEGDGELITGDLAGVDDGSVDGL